jgi:hypothetical protein
MSDNVPMWQDLPWFTPPINPGDTIGDATGDITGVSGLIAAARASEVTYKDRCKMHALAGEGVLLTPRRIGKILGRYPRTVERILL